MCISMPPPPLEIDPHPGVVAVVAVILCVWRDLPELGLERVSPSAGQLMSLRSFFQFLFLVLG